MSKESISESQKQKEENADIRGWLFAMVEVAMEDEKNIELMWQIWKGIQKNEFGEN